MSVERALLASGGGLDFGLLFLGFSLFLIAAALVLVGLLVRLGLDRRASEIGLLLAAGYRTRTVRRLLLAEGMILSALGGLIGLAGAIGYARPHATVAHGNVARRVGWVVSGVTR